MSDILTDLDDLEVSIVDTPQIDHWMMLCDMAIQSSSGTDVPDISVSPIELSEVLIELTEFREKSIDYNVHMAHCNQWPYVGNCKYDTDDACPALKIYIDTDRLAQALFSIEGGLGNTDGTWQDDIVRDKFTERAEQILKLLISDRRQ